MSQCFGATEMAFSSNYPDPRDFRCEVLLQNRDLWKKFHEIGTEMIITKSGRRMFPSLRVQVNNLDPNALYCILLDFTSQSDSRFKYTTNSGWSPAGSAEPQSPHSVYLHPESPATGAQWMAQTVHFNRVKLTNSSLPIAGQVLLNSMHKYQPRVLIVQTQDTRAIPWSPTMSVVFPETQFIAVTAYQNDKITKLKIDNNPFAKGFRENGQSRYKRKRDYDSTKDEDLSKKIDISINTISSDESVTSSPEPSPSGGDTYYQTDKDPLLSCTIMNSHPAPMWYNYPSFSGLYRCPEYDRFANYYISHMPTLWTPYEYMNYMPFVPALQTQVVAKQKTKGLTDFSIKSIIES